MTCIRSLLAGGFAAALASMPLAHAQQAPMPEVSPGEACELTPDEAPDWTTNGAGPGLGGSDATLSETLDRCGSVLVPPPAGDADIITPPPGEGVTPIIPPPAVPEAE
ncbi:MAG: hypothetical protein ACK4U0_12895 [Mesorhizobium sp.]